LGHRLEVGSGSTKKMLLLKIDEVPTLPLGLSDLQKKKKKKKKKKKNFARSDPKQEDAHRCNMSSLGGRLTLDQKFGAVVD